MSRFRKWAASPPVYVPSTPPPPPAPTATPPLVQPHHQGFNPHPRPTTFVQVPTFGGSQRPLQVVSAQPPGCTIVKGNQANWDRFMASIPDVAKAAGIDYSNGVDAVRDLAGIPEFAAMAKWSEGARYYNGVTDQSARNRLDGHVAGYGDSMGDIRNSTATVTRGG